MLSVFRVFDWSQLQLKQDMQIPKQYPYAVTSAVAISIHCWMQAMKVSSFRKQIFNKQFMRQNFGQMHQSQLKQSIMPQGYPDTGSGRYSDRLSYSDWYKFNVLQRNHYNYLQYLPVQVTALLAAGLYKPKQAGIIGIVFILTRILYIQGYTSKHGALNKLRVAGAIGGFLCLLANLGIFGYHAFKFFRSK